MAVSTRQPTPTRRRWPSPTARSSGWAMTTSAGAPPGSRGHRPRGTLRRSRIRRSPCTLTATGLARSGLDLSTARNRPELLDRLRVHVAGLPVDEPVWARGWDESTWSAGQADDLRLPSVAEIDAAVGGRPAYLVRVDEHSALASTALRDGVAGLGSRWGSPRRAPDRSRPSQRARRGARIADW